MGLVFCVVAISLSVHVLRRAACFVSSRCAAVCPVCVFRVRLFFSRFLGRRALFVAVPAPSALLPLRESDARVALPYLPESCPRGAMTRLTGAAGLKVRGRFLHLRFEDG